MYSIQRYYADVDTAASAFPWSKVSAGRCASKRESAPSPRGPTVKPMTLF